MCSFSIPPTVHKKQLIAPNAQKYSPLTMLILNARAGFQHGASLPGDFPGCSGNIRRCSRNIRVCSRNIRGYSRMFPDVPGTSADVSGTSSDFPGTSANVAGCSGNIRGCSQNIRGYPVHGTIRTKRKASDRKGLRLSSEKEAGAKKRCIFYQLN